MQNFEEIQNLLRYKAELQGRLNLIPYDGTVEIKNIEEKRYLYIRKRELGKISSNYVGVYSAELYQVLLKSVKDAKEIKKQIKVIDKELTLLGYICEQISPNVALNLDFVRANMKTVIYDQAVLEGCATTFPDTETILNNGKVKNVNASDIQKILNLKHAWEFILDKDVIQSDSDYYVAQYIAKLVNEGFFLDGGRVRAVPVTIGGCEYVPPIPLESDVKDAIKNIVNKNLPPIDVAVELALFVMKAQVFNDGNKRTAIIFANHYLIAHAGGILVVPEKQVSHFKKLLVSFYEGKDCVSVKEFLKNNCWKKLK